MSFLNRLKKIFTGEKEPEDEKKPNETVKSQKPPVKEESEKPPVEEKEEPVKADAKVSKEPAEDTTEKTAASKKQEETGTEKTEKTEPETPEAITDEPDEEPKKRSEIMSLLQKDESLITRADVDENFKQEIIDAGAESVAICFQCGTCSGACPSGRRTPYKIRQLVRRSVMGLKEDVISDDTIWMCTTCYECQERCPRAIKIVDIVKIVRNYAAQAGYMGPAHKMVGSFVIKTGHGVPINDATMELRKRVGLGELPPTTHSFPGALEEVQKIMKATGFGELIGYNWETGELE
jgi:heterodisulfide reductase subunit C